MASGSYGPVEIFRAGTFAPMNGEATKITEGELQNIALAYDPVNNPASVVIGHPQIDAPAYAWVDRLYVEGGKLKATLKDTAAQFADMVKDGRYKKVSISLFLPSSSANPKPGTMYLKHVGFLGAAAPAVPGLKPVQFSGSAADCIELSQASETAEFGSPQQSELAKLRKKVADQELERLIGEGRVLPAFKQEIVEFAASLDASEALSFADGEATTRRDWFLSYLARQPKVVAFGAADMGDDPFQVAPRPVSVPAGYSLDPQQMELHNRAKQIAREKGISFADAVDLATGR